MKLFLLLMGILVGLIPGYVVIKQKDRQVGEQFDLSMKHLEMFHMMNQWIKAYQSNSYVEDYLLQHEYNKIAIYGMGYAGETLADELRNSKIDVIYGIDINKDNIYADFPLYRIEDSLPSVDALIVTPIVGVTEIKDKLKEKLHCPIILLFDIIYQL